MLSFQQPLYETFLKVSAYKIIDSHLQITFCMCQMLLGFMNWLHEKKSTILTEDVMLTAADKLSGVWAVPGELQSSRKLILTLPNEQYAHSTHSINGLWISKKLYSQILSINTLQQFPFKNTKIERAGLGNSAFWGCSISFVTTKEKVGWRQVPLAFSQAALHQRARAVLCSAALLRIWPPLRLSLCPAPPTDSTRQECPGKTPIIWSLLTAAKYCSLVSSVSKTSIKSCHLVPVDNVETVLSSWNKNLVIVSSADEP